MKTIKLLIIFLCVVGLAACTTQMQLEGSSSGSGENGEDGGTITPTLPALEDLSHVIHTRATIQWDHGDGRTYESDNGGEEFVPIEPTCADGICTYIVPNLDPYEQYTVNVQYYSDGELSYPASVSFSTSLEWAYHTLNAGESSYGLNADAGDVNGDGYPDFIAATRDGAVPQDGRVDLFLGGPDNIPSGDTGLEPYAAFTSPLMPGSLGNPVLLGYDADCDGVGDILLGHSSSNPANLSMVRIFSGKDLAAGAYDVDTDTDYTLADNDNGTDFGWAFDAAADTLYIGAKSSNVGRGDVFRVDGCINSDMVIGDAFGYAMPLGVTEAGYFVRNVGPVGGADDMVMFNNHLDSLHPNDRHVDIRWSDALLAGDVWDVLDSYNTGYIVSAGPLPNGSFYISVNTATGAEVYIYDDRDDTDIDYIRADDDADFGFGYRGVVACDFYPSVEGTELLIGGTERIYVYSNYGGDLSYQYIGSHDIPGVNLQIGDTDNDGLLDADYNGDGYVDILTYEPLTHTNTGAIMLHY